MGRSTRDEARERMSQFGLLGARRFGPFFWTQFLGALNDNLFKNALVILFAFRMSGVAFSENTLVNLSTGLLTLPFFLFSASAGQIADKFDKARIIRLVKLFEIGIMLLGAAGLHLHSVPLLLGVVFLMGTHSAVFGPVKYSILPQHLHADELVGGNALVQMGTFAAILLGTILGGALVKIGGEATVSATVLALAGAGWLASRGVPPAPAPAADLRLDWNPLRETLRIVGFARENRTVFLSILGISWFWFYGALFLAQFPGLTRHVLGGDEWVATLLLVVFSVGVALGCMLCERLSSRTVELGLVPFGSIGLSLFAADLFFATRGLVPAGTPIGVLAFLGRLHHWRVLADLVLIGAFGGVFIVPLQPLFQHGGGARGRPGLQSRELRRCAGDRRRLPAPDPLRDGPQLLPHAGPQFLLSHRARHPDRIAQGRPEGRRAGVRCGGARARGGEPRVHLPRGPADAERRSRPLPSRHRARRRAHAGARRPHGAPRPLGQLLQPQGRARHEPALPALLVAHRVRVRRAHCGPAGDGRRAPGARARPPRRAALTPMPSAVTLAAVVGSVAVGGLVVLAPDRPALLLLL